MMRIPILTVLGALSVLSAGSLIAQSSNTTVLHGVTPPPLPAALGGTSAPPMFSSGYARAGVKGQPYSLLATTTTTRTLGDGTTIRSVRLERRMRDTEGRTRTENSRIVDGAPKLEYILLVDPVARTRTMLFVNTKTAEVTHLPPAPPPLTPEQEAQVAAARQQARAAADARHALDTTNREVQTHSHGDFSFERLGPQNVAGVSADGLRTTRVIPAGREDNDRQIRSVREVWTSPELQIEVGSSSDDPRTGKTTMVATELERSAPDPALFQTPADYTVQESKTLLQGTPPPAP